MTSDTGAVARIVDGLREIVARREMMLEAARLSFPGESEGCKRALLVARECLAVAEAQR